MKEVKFKCESCDSRSTATDSKGWVSILPEENKATVYKGILDEEGAHHFCGAKHAMQYLSGVVGAVSIQ